MRTHTRWMIRRDFPEVLDIEQASFGKHAWSEEDFLNVLRQRNCIGQVAETIEREPAVIGYLLYELLPKCIKLVNLAVHPDHRRSGVASALVNKVIGKLNPGKRERVICTVHEANLPTHLFLRALDFQCVEVQRAAFEDADGYSFKLTLADRIKAQPVSALCCE